MSLIGGIASGSSPEVIPLRPSQEAAGSVLSITVIEISPRPRVLITCTLAPIAAAFAPAPTMRMSLSLTAPPQTGVRVGDSDALGPAARGSAITSPFWSGLKEIALLRARSPLVSTARSSVLSSTIRSTRFISISA